MDSKEKIPKVFISYCWTSEQHINWVRSLAEKLVADSGVDIILDQWHGEIGHDRYHFMEESIRVADKVLVICDKKYCDRANDRAGGVGTETRIITPEVYRSNKNDKFIPIALELNEHGEYLLPDFMSSRFALGMIKEKEFDSNYRKLERLIWQVPLLKPPVRGKRPDFENNRESYKDKFNKPKLLYLYAYLAESGINHIKSKSLIDALKENYDIQLAYGICEDDTYRKIKNPSLRKQLIPEKEFIKSSFQVMIIENRFGKIDENKLKTEKFRLNLIELFIQNGGLCIFLLADDIIQYGTSGYNQLLKKAGLPLVREARSNYEFPYLHLVDELNLSKYIIYGWDEKSAIEYPRTYKIIVDDQYYRLVNRDVLPIFKDVKQLVVSSTMQVDVGVGNVLLTANKQTKMLATGDLMWDGDNSHYFGSYKENEYGVGILIGSNICSDNLLFMHETDSLILMENTINYFLNIIESRKSLMS
ncbi:SEFIR domain-containing protein [Lysinibacillus sp. C5.1]|uniref:SEFIR domain-containing protein n=1 Tax=Lysinibacillus sp. C5.1 TaxID=2796169 RepID=UPI003082149C